MLDALASEGQYENAEGGRRTSVGYPYDEIDVRNA